MTYNYTEVFDTKLFYVIHQIFFSIISQYYITINIAYYICW